jgi:Tol biopolymer transport system component
MPLSAGFRLGPYEIQSALGAGGMGEVYRARDTKLNRDVALKILPSEFALDPDRLARFKREAQMLAALNHPNIGSIYGLEDSGAVIALVLELVEGPTLADRIADGPLTIDEALPIARQIVDALESAHEQGIVHRDLKPANIKVRDDTTVKVLDFGLAKLAEPAAAGGVAPTLTRSPTITSPAMTAAGIILGTAAYMAPEQAKGKPADKRSDIWAFGCVLFEMLTGRRPFHGDDVVSTLAFVLTKEPDWNALPARTPESIRRLLRRTLTKERMRRLGDIADARLDIDEAVSGVGGEAPSAAQPPSRRWFFGVVAGGVLGAVVVAAMALIALNRRNEKTPPPIQFSIPPPRDTSLLAFTSVASGAAPELAVSPDGQRVVFVVTAEGKTSLWLRTLSELDAVPLRGTENATYPFWSPDGRFIAFFGDGKLKKVPPSGGPASVICDASGSYGGTWNEDNVILFSDTRQGVIERVSGSSGAATPATRRDRQETQHFAPQFLPDRRSFLYSTRALGATDLNSVTVRLTALGSNESTVLIEAESGAAFANGFLFFLRDANLMAQRLDVAQRRVTGDPVFIAAGVSREDRAAAFSVSPAGVLAFGASAPDKSRLVWKDRTGREVGIVGSPGSYTNVTLSRDGRHIAVSLASGSPPVRNIWTMNLEGNASTQVTFGSVPQALPVWSPDASTLVYTSYHDKRFNLSQRSITADRAEAVLLDAGAGGEGIGRPLVSDWSDDGRYIAYAHGDRASSDIWIVPVRQDISTAGQGALWHAEKPIAFARTPADEDNPVFAPGSRWVAYQSNESGHEEVYVQPFPATGVKYRVSRDGGAQPMWSPGATEVFFLAPNGDMMAATVQFTPHFEAGAPHALFTSGTDPTVGTLRHTYAVSRDGQRFLVNVPERKVAPSITVLVNWPNLLRN